MEGADNESFDKATISAKLAVLDEEPGRESKKIAESTMSVAISSKSRERIRTNYFLRKYDDTTLTDLMNKFPFAYQGRVEALLKKAEEQAP
jgi:hypothetical protein